VHADQAPDDLFDWRRLAEYLTYVLGSVQRRPLLFAVVLLSVLGMAAVAVNVITPTYQVETRLLAQRNATLAVRGDQSAFDTPNHAATEIIVRRDNLRALIQQTNLIQEWRKRRPLLGRIKDSVYRWMGKVMSDAELEDALVGLLEKRLLVWTTPEGLVTIQLNWPDAEMAYRMVDAAQRNFLEARHVIEVETIAELISILDSNAAKLKNEMDERVAELERLRDERSPRRHRPAVPRRLPSLPASPEVTRLQVLLEAKRRAIHDLEEFRSRTVLEAQTRLAELRAIYAENHPAILDQQQKISGLSAESPQVSRLRQDEEQLRKELGAHADRPEGSAMAAAIPPDVLDPSADLEGDSVTEYARTQLRFLHHQYAALREKIDSARIDFDTARAAFKYRYTVVLPAEKPKRPIKPKPLPVYAAAFLVGIGAALLSTGLSDLRKGRVVAAWQLERIVGHKVIEVHRS
jgi:hypothetical protein